MGKIGFKMVVWGRLSSDQFRQARDFSAKGQLTVRNPNNGGQNG